MTCNGGQWLFPGVHAAVQWIPRGARWGVPTTAPADDGRLQTGTRDVDDLDIDNDLRVGPSRESILLEGFPRMLDADWWRPSNERHKLAAQLFQHVQ